MARGFAASKTKKEFLERLGLEEGVPESEEIFRKMLDEATLGRQRVSQNPMNLVPSLRDDPLAKGPFTYSQITETARHNEILHIYRTASATTRPYYNQGYYLDGANEENWVIRWCLYHSFRYTDNRNRNRTRGSRNTASQSSLRSPSSSSPTMELSPASFGIEIPPLRPAALAQGSQSTSQEDESAMSSISQTQHTVRTDYYDPARDL